MNALQYSLFPKGTKKEMEKKCGKTIIIWKLRGWGACKQRIDWWSPSSNTYVLNTYITDSTKLKACKCEHYAWLYTCHESKPLTSWYTLRALFSSLLSLSVLMRLLFLSYTGNKLKWILKDNCCFTQCNHIQFTV